MKWNRMICVLLSSVMAVGLSACNQKNDNAAVKLPVESAAISGQGYDENGNSIDSFYDEENGVLSHPGDNTQVVFTVPDEVEGEYDIYLEFGRSIYAAGTTFFSVAIGDGEDHVPIVEMAASQSADDLNEMGLVPVRENVYLQSGDLIKISYKPGYSMEWQGVMSCALPTMGNMYLYQTGTPVAVGYGEERQVAEDTAEKIDSSDPLSGKSIVWLGSSVTFGDNGYSIADAIDETHSAVNTYKYAISGTMLVNTSESSYVARMKEIDPALDIDLFIVQLSTNDATNGQPLGEVSNSREVGSFDDATITGAMEEIIAYVSQTWNCPIAFYTGTYYDSAEYQSMVDRLYELQEKWQIEIIDLWNNENLRNMCISGESAPYMKIKYGTEDEPDPIHPNAKGYKQLWTPEFEKSFAEIFTE